MVDSEAELVTAAKRLGEGSGKARLWIDDVRKTAVSVANEAHGLTTSARKSENLARKLPQTTRYAKQHLNFWRDLAWHETINHARDWLALSMATDEPRAAIEKFLKK